MQQMQVGVETIEAMIQKAGNLLAEAQAVGGQYIAHSEDIIGAGWSGPACTTSHTTAMQVKNDLDQALAAHLELNDLLNKAKLQYLAHQADSSHELAGVHPTGNPSAQSM